METNDIFCWPSWRIIDPNHIFTNQEIEWRKKYKYISQSWDHCSLERKCLEYLKVTQASSWAVKATLRAVLSQHWFSKAGKRSYSCLILHLFISSEISTMQLIDYENSLLNINLQSSRVIQFFRLHQVHCSILNVGLRWWSLHAGAPHRKPLFFLIFTAM